jgi:ubiquinone/menaquinone biosynthesis C-methylase UbiE
LGDYHRFALEQMWGIGPMVVEATGIAPGQRVLDVAAGSGNVAIRAADAGAEVVALDITPENLEAGRREAEAQGVNLERVEGDAQALPFGDSEFDVVTSSFGAIFAPDHQKVADELLRVCRPGGKVGLTTSLQSAWQRTSSVSLRRTCLRRHWVHSPRSSGGQNNTCGNSSATASRR